MVLTGFNYIGQAEVWDKGRMRVYSIYDSNHHLKAWHALKSEQQIPDPKADSPGPHILAKWVFMAGDPTEYEKIKEAIYVGYLHGLVTGDIPHTAA